MREIELCVKIIEMDCWWYILAVGNKMKNKKIKINEHSKKN